MGPLGCSLLDGSHSLQDYSAHRDPLTHDVLEVLVAQEHLADQQDLEDPSYHSREPLGHLGEWYIRGYLSIQMTFTGRLPGAPGGPLSPVSPIPLSPLSPFGPWGPTDTKQIQVYHKIIFVHLFIHYKDLNEMYHLAFLGFQGGLVDQYVQVGLVYQGAQKNLVIRLFLEVRDDLEMLPSPLASACETCSRPSSLRMGDKQP